MLYRPDECLQCLLDHRPCDVVCGIGGIDFVLKVERWSSSAETECGYVFFCLALEFFYPFCRFAGAYYHDSCGERVECPGVSHLDFFLADAFADGYP